jgi:hypothetical protein
VKPPRPKAPDGRVPVDPERLRREFPSLDDGDMEAYLEVTRRILAEADPINRARVTRETLTRARAARAAGAHTTEDLVALRYLAAVEKMQRH